MLRKWIGFLAVLVLALSVSGFSEVDNLKINTTGNVTGSYFFGNGTYLTDGIVATASVVTSNITALQDNDTVLYANASGQSTHLTTLFTNASGQSTHISSLWTNATAQSAWITSLWGNATDQDGLVYANTNGVVDLWSNASGQASHVTVLYGNASDQDARIISLEDIKTGLSFSDYAWINGSNDIVESNVSVSSGDVNVTGNLLSQGLAMFGAINMGSNNIDSVDNITTNNLFVGETFNASGNFSVGGDGDYVGLTLVGSSHVWNTSGGKLVFDSAADVIDVGADINSSKDINTTGVICDSTGCIVAAGSIAGPSLYLDAVTNNWTTNATGSKDIIANNSFYAVTDFCIIGGDCLSTVTSGLWEANDGSGISPINDLQVNITGGVIVSDTGLSFKVSEDLDDYLQFLTESDVPTIRGVGSSNDGVYIKSDDDDDSFVYIRLSGGSDGATGIEFETSDGAGANIYRYNRTHSLYSDELHIRNAAEIMIKPSNDPTDYIYFDTVSNIARISPLDNNSYTIGYPGKLFATAYIKSTVTSDLWLQGGDEMMVREIERSDGLYTQFINKSLLSVCPPIRVVDEFTSELESQCWERIADINWNKTKRVIRTYDGDFIDSEGNSLRDTVTNNKKLVELLLDKGVLKQSDVDGKGFKAGNKSRLDVGIPVKEYFVLQNNSSLGVDG